LVDEPPLDEELLDALALVYARAALDRLMRELHPADNEESNDEPHALAGVSRTHQL
jgi:hypothetical protein